VVLDIFSRYAPGWLVANTEDAVVAKDFLADAVTRNGVIPHTIHADRGGSMTSKPVSEPMIDLSVRRSHSRPRCSNDNPYSEAQFKTLKYLPDFPDRFGSLADARGFCERFFTAYNHEHRHSGIGMHTQPRSISTPRPRSAPTVRPPSTALTRSTPSGSPAGPPRRTCPSRHGSTGPSYSQPSEINCLVGRGTGC
jgi:transposase InsO family protein